MLWRRRAGWLRRLHLEAANLTLPEQPEIRCGEHLVVAYDLTVDSSLVVRPARVHDIGQMARVHVRCWQETYRGLMPDALLDDPGLPAARERMWTRALTDERYRRNRGWMRQLYVLYVYAADHGTGAGRALLEAVTDSAEPTALWVADPNPRAQAFYRKHGFDADGTARSDDGPREIRMVRGVRPGGTGRSSDR